MYWLCTCSKGGVNTQDQCKYIRIDIGSNIGTFCVPCVLFLAGISERGKKETSTRSDSSNLNQQEERNYPCQLLIHPVAVSLFAHSAKN